MYIKIFKTSAKHVFKDCTPFTNNSVVGFALPFVTVRIMPNKMLMELVRFDETGKSETVFFDVPETGTKLIKALKEFIGDTAVNKLLKRNYNYFIN